MLIAVFEYLFLLAVSGFAFKMGGRAERQGASWLLLNVGLHAVLTLGGVGSPTPHLIADGVYATGLIPLAFLHVSWWIGVMALIECASFILQAVYLVTDQTIDLTFAQINNALFLAAVLTLLISAVASMLQRRSGTAPSLPMTELTAA